MYLLLIALLLTVLKGMEIGPVAEWSWWVVVGAYGTTAAWWWWADATGYTRRRAEDRMAERKQKRIAQQREAMGLKQRPRR